jgi:hypothetical protein
MTWTDTTRRSSNIARVGYDVAHLTLGIEFKSRGTWLYQNVSPIDHLKFMSQPSLGKAYNQMFYGKPKLYPSTKVAPTSGH